MLRTLKEWVDDAVSCCKVAFEEGRRDYRLSRLARCICELDDPIDGISECDTEEEGVDKVIGDPENKNGGHSIGIRITGCWTQSYCTCGWESAELVTELAQKAGQAHLLEATGSTQVARRAALFQTGEFHLHSGEVSNFKIDCDALTDSDWESLAHMVANRVGRFSSVEGVPRGGLKLAEKLQSRVWGEGPVLIVDDVLTTGASMEQQRAGRDAIGAVVFARSQPPPWVTPLFTLTPQGCLQCDSPQANPGTGLCGPCSGEAEAKDQGSADTGQMEIRKWGLAGPDVVMAGKCPHCFMGVSVVRSGKGATVSERAVVDIDHCPKCGEYLHDEMGHVCPDGGSGSGNRPERAVNPQVVDEPIRQAYARLMKVRCTVCGVELGFHPNGPWEDEEIDKWTCGRTVTQVLEYMGDQSGPRDNGLSPSSSGIHHPSQDVQEGPSPSDTATNGAKVVRGDRKSHSKAQNGNKRGKNGAQGTDKRGKSKKTGAHTPNKAKSKKKKGLGDVVDIMDLI